MLGSNVSQDTDNFDWDIFFADFLNPSMQML
jgi:hypothetical protein